MAKKIHVTTTINGTETGDANNASGDDYFLYDMITFGPQIGLSFHF